MELLCIGVRHFGGFGELGVQFSPRARGLHILHGLNEAGKSTLRRATLKLFFGFEPKQDPDVQKRSRSGTAIEAVVATPRGRLFLRRTAHRNRLTNREQEVSAEELAGWLRGLGREEFEHVFCLGHEELRKGGKAILSLRSDQGSLLFVAAGVLNVDQVRSDIQRDIENMYTQRSRNKELDQLFETLTKLRDQTRSLQVNPDDVEKLQNQLEEQRRQLDALKQERTAVRHRQRLLDRFRELRRLEQQIGQTRRSLAQYSDLPDVSLDLFEQAQGVAKRLQELTTQLAQTRESASHLQHQLHQISAEIAAKPMTRVIGTLQPGSVQAIRDRLKRFRRASERFAELVLDLREALLSIQKWLDSVLGQKTPHLRQALEQARRLYESLPWNSVDELRSRYDKLTGQLDNAAENEQRLTGEISKLEKELEAYDTALGRELLATPQAILREAEEAMEEAKRADEQLGELQGTIADLRTCLGLRDVPAEVIRGASAPGSEQVREVVEQLKKQSEHCLKLRDRLESLRKEVEALESKLSEGEHHELSKLQDNLQSTRKRRDQLWGEIRGYLVHRPESLKDLPELERAHLASEYEAQVKQVDRLSEQLLGAARELESLRLTTQKLQSARQAIHEVEAELAKVQDEQGRTQQKFRELWQELYVGQTPEESITWLHDLRRLQGALEKEAVLLERRRRCHELVRSNVNKVFTLLGHDIPIEADSPQVALTLAREQLARLETRQATASQYAERLADKRRELERYREHAQRIQAELRRIERQLAQALCLTLKTPQLSTVFARLHEFRAAYESVVRSLGRLNERLKSYVLLKAAVRQALGSWYYPKAVAELIDRYYEDAVKLLEKEGGTTEELELQQRKLEELQKQVQDLQQQLNAIFEQTGCKDVESLWELRERIKERRRIEADLRGLLLEKEQVAEEVSLQDFPELQADATDDDIEALHQELDKHEQELADLIVELQSKVQDSERRLREYEEQDEALARTAWQYSETVARVTDLARRYVTLKASHRLLENAIELHRERTGRLLEERGSELFHRLTGGRFRGFRLDPTGEELPHVLKSENEDLELHMLSDGTADQLYLALRIAAIESFVATNGPLPVILDDVLVHFDDERARYALEALAELGQKTQVLLFTHHRRIAELAGELETGVYCHELNNETGFPEELLATANTT